LEQVRALRTIVAYVFYYFFCAEDYERVLRTCYCQKYMEYFAMCDFENYVCMSITQFIFKAVVRSGTEILLRVEALTEWWKRV